MKYKMLLVIWLSIFLLFGIGITYSFFNSNALMNSANQNIAKFIFNAEDLNQLNLSLIDLNPGDTKEYLFAITNNDSDISSNVSIEYQMTIKTYHFIPLIIELYKLNDEIEELIMTCDESYTRNNENELICNTPVQMMDYSNLEVDNYKLIVNFPSEYDDSIYSHLVDYINIDIKSWQK